MIPDRSCAECGAPTQHTQRYCVACGKRLGPLRVPGTVPLILNPDHGSLAAFRAPRSAGVLSAVVLGMGVLVGVSIGPTYGTGGARTVINVPGAATPPGVAGEMPALGDPAGSEEISGEAIASTTQIAAGVSTPSSITSTTTTPSEEEAPAEATPAEPAAKNLTYVTGTVLHGNPGANSYTLATNDGRIISIHSGTLPPPTDHINLPIRQLFNRTYAEEGAREKLKESKEATVPGTVTFVDSVARVYTVSNRGSSLLVHAPTSTNALPKVGDVVTAEVKIEPAPAPGGSGPGDPPTHYDPTAVLQETKLEVKSTAKGAVDLEGIVQSVDQESRQLVLSADDIRESGRDVTLTVPDSVPLTALKVGKTVDVTATIGTNNTFTVTGLSRDDGEAGANDSSSAYGDQK